MIFRVGPVMIETCRFCRMKTDFCVEMLSDQPGALGSSFVAICPTCRKGLLDTLTDVPNTLIRRLTYPSGRVG
jgi:hypothetical protein